MGTRSLTFVHSGIATPKPFLNMYRQMDGYPSGHGKELYEFLKPIKMVNGITTGKTDVIANGPGCLVAQLVAQLVAHFKGGAGGIYLESPSATDCGQDYEYRVFAGDTEIKVKCYEKRHGKSSRLLFAGTVEEFGEFCNKPGTDD